MCGSGREDEDARGDPWARCRGIGHTVAVPCARWLAALFLLAALPAALLAKPVTLNLKDADIRTVIATVSEITGKNFVVDPRVKGKVTVISSRPMEAEAVYPIFLSILKVHGFAAVPIDGVIKIVPEANAKQDAIPTLDGGGAYQGDQFVTRVISVENVAAAALVPILRPLVPPQGHLAAYPSSNVLVASASAAKLQRLVQVIRRIDQVSDTGIEIVPLQHASAVEAVRILKSLEQGQVKDQKVAPAHRVTLVADVRTNSVLLSGDQSERLRMKAIVTILDTPLASSGDTRVIYLHYAKAEDLVSVLTGVSDEIGGVAKGARVQAKPAPSGAVKILADQSINALVISAPPDVMRELETIVRQLDLRRAQVLVKAVIAEVSSDAATELGVQFAYDGRDNDSGIGVVNFGGSGSGIANLLEQPPIVSDGLTLVLGQLTGATRIAAVINALSGYADTNILSTPTLVTLDNEEAEIVVGQNVPFVTGSFSNTGQGSTPTNPFQTIERQDVGLTLRIRPQINEGDAIRLDISQEVSSLSPSVTGASDLVTNRRALHTSVLVDDGQILALGGLIQDDLRQSVQKVPGLGDIPLIGKLFTFRKTSKVKQNLMVFLQPVILRGGAQSAALSSEKYNYFRARQLDVRRRGVNLMPNQESPLLPPIEDFTRLPRAAVPPPAGATHPGAGAPPVARPWVNPDD